VAEYNPFKADVFALAASVLHIATLTSPEALVTAEHLNEAVEREITELAISEPLQRLIKSMLNSEESLRPTMLQVCCTVTELKPAVKYFAAVWENKVERYHLKSQQSTTFTLPVKFGKGGSYIAMGRTTLMCLGADPASTAVYELDLSSAQLTDLPPLSVSRNGAGVAKAAHCVYVFGSWVGKKASLKSCEKYDLQEKRVQALIDMQYGRCFFTPCTFRSLIYLACPFTTPVIETFDPRTETFTVLPVSLPPDMKYLSVAVVAHQELCILTSGEQGEEQQMGLWKIETESEFRRSVSQKGCCSCQPPLIVGSVVLIANIWANRVEKFSLESYSFI